METLLNFFEKLSTSLKLKVSVTVIGLLVPSLVYFIFNFSSEFFSAELIKVLIACVTINFVIIFILTFIIMINQIIISIYRKKFIKQYQDCLDLYRNQYKDRLEILKGKFDEQVAIGSEMTEIDKEINLIWNIYEKIEKQDALFTSYIRDFLNIGYYIGIASFYCIFIGILQSLNNLLFSQKVELNPYAIINNVKSYIISFTIVIFVMNIVEDIEKVKKLNKHLKDIESLPPKDALN